MSKPRVFDIILGLDQETLKGLREVGWYLQGDDLLMPERPAAFSARVAGHGPVWLDDNSRGRFLVAVEHPLDIWHEYSWSLRLMTEKNFYVWAKKEGYEEV